MRFDYAKNDANRANEEDLEFEIFQLPNAKGDDDEDYCAVRPSEELLITLTQDVYLLQEQPYQAVEVLNRIMGHAFSAIDIRDALIESGEFEDRDGDGDGELNAYALTLVNTNNRLAYRRSTPSRRDKLGTETLAQVAVWLIEKWSGKATGKPQDFLPPQKPTGRSSKRTSSSRPAANRSRSSARSASAGS